MEIAKLVLDYLKAVVVWPLVAVFSIWFFRKEVHTVLERLADLIDRVKKANFAGLSLEMYERMANQAKPRISQGGSATELELSASVGGYSTEYRAIFVVVGITNRTDEADQVVEWKLHFPDEAVELEPSPAPPNIVSPVRRWSESTVEIPANRFIQGTLFFRGRDVLQQALQAAPLEPLVARLSATTLHEKKLESQVKVYLLSTLQQNPALDP